MRFVGIIALLALATPMALAGKDFNQCIDQYVTKFVAAYKKDLPETAKSACLETFTKNVRTAASNVSDKEKSIRETEMAVQFLHLADELYRCLVKEGVDKSKASEEYLKVVSKLEGDFKKCHGTA